MATRNIQMNILTDSGSYDTLYPQTTASQAGARPSTWMPTASDVGARPSTWTPTASQVGALPISGGTLTGDLKIKNSNNYGTTLSFGDGTYCQISEPTDDCMDIKAKKVNFTISDTSDSRFTINNVNPFGANGDSENYSKFFYMNRQIFALSSTAIVIQQVANIFIGSVCVFIMSCYQGSCVLQNSAGTEKMSNFSASHIIWYNNSKFSDGINTISSALYATGSGKLCVTSIGDKGTL